LLHEAGYEPTLEKDQDDQNDEIYDTYGMHFYGIAPETCLGYSRLRHFGNNQTLKPDSENVVVDQGLHDVNMVYLRGRWTWLREGVSYRHAGNEQNAAVLMKYNAAKRVHGIVGTSDGNPGRIEIKLDGNYLTKDQLGKDVRLEGNVSFSNIEWPFVHNFVKTEKPETKEIEIIPRTGNIIFYTFVFG